MFNSFNHFVNLNIPNPPLAENKSFVFFNLHKKPTVKSLSQDREILSVAKKSSTQVSQVINKALHKTSIRSNSILDDTLQQNTSQQTIGSINEQNIKGQSENLKSNHGILDPVTNEFLQQNLHNYHFSSTSDVKRSDVNIDSSEEESKFRIIIDRNSSVRKTLIAAQYKNKKGGNNSSTLNEKEKTEMKNALIKNILDGNIGSNKKDDSVLNKTLSSTLGYKSVYFERGNTCLKKDIQKYRTFEEVSK